MTTNQGADFIMTDYLELEEKIVQWAKDRRIVQNSTCMAQAIKTLEEVHELLEAILKQEPEAQKDAYGDILVTLIVGCATAGVSLVDCLELAYGQIKDRKGYLTEQGVFVKEVV
jgi:NTP pyrophosphatase (non-canonical NTP hydrolase)